MQDPVSDTTHQVRYVTPVTRMTYRMTDVGPVGGHTDGTAHSCVSLGGLWTPPQRLAGWGRKAAYLGVGCGAPTHIFGCQAGVPHTKGTDEATGV